MNTLPEPTQTPSIQDGCFVTKAGEGEAVERERETGRRLISNRLLAKNAVWNLLGGAIPMLAAIFAIPRLTRGMGTDRFGILTLAWVLIGYFGLFDLGLSRALTKLVSEKLGAGKHHEVAGAVWTSLFLMMVLGGVGTVLIFVLSPWLVHSVLKIPPAIQTETIHSFILLGLSIPLVIGTTGLRGYLEAQQYFHAVNAIRTPLSVFNFIGPLFVLPFTNSLTVIVGVLVCGRIVAWVAHLVYCLRVSPSLRRMHAPDGTALRSLLRFGSWMTVSNIVGPLMIYSDRFLVGAIVSVMAVAYYATPYEVVNKLLIVPTAVAGVLFPAFSTAYSCDHSRMVKLFERGCRCVLLILFPVTLIVVTFAHEILNVWLGPAFARNSTTVLQLLAVGILINSLAQIPFALLQGVGRPDLTAKLHLLELSLYLPVVWWATTRYGIQGTAAVWLLRATLDAVVLFAWVQEYVAASPRAMAKIGLFTSCGLPILAVGLFPFGLLFKAVFVSVNLLLFLLASWFWVLTSQERVVVQGYIGALQMVEPG